VGVRNCYALYITETCKIWASVSLFAGYRSVRGPRFSTAPAPEHSFNAALH